MEREREVDTLSTSIADVVGGAGRLVLVEGPAGIGKSRLLEEACRLAAAAGLAVRTARGGELERDFPFGVALQLFGRLLEGREEDHDPGLLEGAAGLARGLVDVHEGGWDGRQPGAEFSLVYGLHWLTLNLAERRPPLLAVDDAHWADEESLRWLSYLVRRIEDAPILVLVGVRSGESASRQELLARLGDAPGTALLRPRPLSADGTAVLVGEAMGGTRDALAGACHEVTGGNPLLLSQLLGALEAGELDPGSPEEVRGLAPEAVSRAVLIRLSRLGAEARTLAEAVAVLGSRAELAHAAELAGMDQPRAAECADKLAALQILGRGRPVAFAHPVVRTAVYSQLPVGARETAHASAARILARVGEPAEAVATHLLKSPPGGEAWVVETLVEAARRSRRRGAPEAAARYLRRALAEPPEPRERGGLLAWLGEVEARAGRGERGLELYREALELADDAETRAEIALIAGPLVTALGRPGEALELFDSVLPDLEAPRLVMQIDSAAMIAAWFDQQTRELDRERAARVRATASGDTSAERAALAAIAFQETCAGGPREQVRDLARRALADGRLLEEETAQSPALYMAVNALICADELAEAESVLAEAMDEARSRGAGDSYAFASTFRSRAAYRLGRLADAAAHAQTGMELADRLRLAPMRSLARAFLADVLLERDPLDAEELLSEASEGLAGSAMFDTVLERRGRLRLVQGRHREALEDLLECGRAQDASGARNPALIAWRSQAALAASLLGDVERARELSADDVAAARAFGAPLTLGATLRVAGLLADGPDGPDGRTLLEEAVSVLEGSPARLEHAKALVDLGAGLRREGRAREAREVLREGLDVASRCGAALLSARAEEELRAAGARPRRKALRGTEALTPSELRVSMLAAHGRTNREIAQELFVTIKTVEMHLRNAYRKLEIESREGLPGALAGEGAGRSRSLVGST